MAFQEIYSGLVEKERGEMATFLPFARKVKEFEKVHHEEVENSLGEKGREASKNR